MQTGIDLDMSDNIRCVLKTSTNSFWNYVFYKRAPFYEIQNGSICPEDA